MSRVYTEKQEAKDGALGNATDLRSHRRGGITTTEKALFSEIDVKIVKSGVSDANPLLKAIYWNKMINWIKRWAESES